MATLGNAENNDFLNRLADRLVQVEVETLDEEQPKADSKAQVKE